ncbi:MAG: hypothetical protein AAF443_08395 [Chlamydiota bacterium]
MSAITSPYFNTISEYISKIDSKITYEKNYYLAINNSSHKVEIVKNNFINLAKTFLGFLNSDLNKIKFKYEQEKSKDTSNDTIEDRQKTAMRNNISHFFRSKKQEAYNNSIKKKISDCFNFCRKKFQPNYQEMV